MTDIVERLVSLWCLLLFDLKIDGNNWHSIHSRYAIVNS